MDNQNYDPINSENVTTSSENNDQTIVTTEGSENTMLNADVAPAQTYDFKAALDVEYRDNPSITKFTNINDMAKSMINLQHMLGKEKAVIPQDLSDKEAISAYMSKIGKPENVDGYNIEYDSEGLGRDLDLDGFKQFALDNNFTAQQAQGLIEWYSGNLKSAMTGESEARKQAIADANVALRQEWGAAYNEKMNKTKTFFEQNFASLKEDNALMEALGNNPKFIKEMSALAGKFGEANIGDVPKQVTLTPAEAKSERAKLMGSDAYMQPAHPEHQATVDKARDLLTIQMSG